MDLFGKKAAKEKEELQKNMRDYNKQVYLFKKGTKNYSLY